MRISPHGLALSGDEVRLTLTWASVSHQVSVSPCLAVISSTSCSCSLALRAVFGGEGSGLISNPLSARLWGWRRWNNEGERHQRKNPPLPSSRWYLGSARNVPRAAWSDTPISPGISFLTPDLHLPGRGGCGTRCSGSQRARGTVHASIFVLAEGSCVCLPQTGIGTLWERSCPRNTPDPLLIGESPLLQGDLELCL